MTRELCCYARRYNLGSSDFIWQAFNYFNERHEVRSHNKQVAQVDSGAAIMAKATFAYA